MEPIVDRLKRFLDHKNLTANKLADLLGYDSSEKISRLFRKEGAKPSADIIEDIANKFADLNLDWWISGRGEMLKDNTGTGPVKEVMVSVSLTENEAQMIAANLKLLYSAFAKPAGSDAESLVPDPVPADNFALGKKKNKSR